MNRIVLHIVLPLVAAAATAFNLIAFRLENLMDPAVPEAATLAWYAAAVVVSLATAYAVVRFRRSGWLLLVAMLIVIVAAGFVPRAVDIYAESERIAADQAEGATIEMEFQSALLDRTVDVEERIAAKRPFTAEEGLAFLEFAVSADLTYRSLPDHTTAAFALVDAALKGGILDPDALMTPPTADSPAVSLILAYYDKNIRPGSPNTIGKHEWDLLQKLVVHGADLSMPDAAALRADLGKTVVAGSSRFIRLQEGSQP